MASVDVCKRSWSDVSIIELSRQEAAEFTGGAPEEVPNTQPYLVRALYLNRETGRFSAYLAQDQLVVHHDSLGSSAVPMKRQALVLQLGRVPVKVFVSCSMAE